jgi:hypothetical protein
MDVNPTVAAEYSHRIDFYVWLDRCNMQLHSFRYRVLLMTTLLLILPYFTVLHVSVIHYIVKSNEQAFLFQKYI